MVAKHQRINAAVIIIHNNMHLVEAGLGLASLKRDQPQVFSVYLNDLTGEIWIHWQNFDAAEGAEQYSTGLLREYHFRQPQGFKDFHRALRNITDWGKTEWLTTVKQNLDAVHAKLLQNRQKSTLWILKEKGSLASDISTFL